MTAVILKPAMASAIAQAVNSRDNMAATLCKAGFTIDSFSAESALLPGIKLAIKQARVEKALESFKKRQKGRSIKALELELSDLGTLNWQKLSEAKKEEYPRIIELRRMIEQSVPAYIKSLKASFEKVEDNSPKKVINLHSKIDSSLGQVNEIFKRIAAYQVDDSLISKLAGLSNAMQALLEDIKTAYPADTKPKPKTK